MIVEDFRLVIINDDPDDVALLRQCTIDGLERKVTFVVADCGEEGVRVCLESGSPRPDCVILDHHLADMSGIDVLERLRDPAGDLLFPVVLFIDSGSQCKAAAAALRVGAQDYISKTWITADGLACAIENAVERHERLVRMRAKRTALNQRDREFKALVENAPDIITRFDTQFRYLYINPAVERATGLPPEHFVGKSCREAGMSEELCGFWDAKLREVSDARREISFEFESESPGGRRAYQARLVPEFSAAGEIESILGVSTEITDRKQAEQALRDADRRKDEFLAMLAHELRNPLAAIRSSAHLIRLKGPDEPSLNWSRDVIERQVKHLTRLIDDLMDVSRIRAGKIQLEKTRLDVGQVIARAAEAVRPLIDAKQHQLSIVLPPAPLPAKADPARLEQVVCNLLTNAAKYTDKRGELTLSGSLEGPWVVIRVRDNGIGIAPEMISQVFDLFTQVNSTVDRSQGGLGIGLTLVKTLVEMHGGSVSASSEGTGRGSEFTVRIPAMGEDAAPVARPPGATISGEESPAPAGTAKILVVDDNVDMSTGMGLFLEKHGYIVRSAGDGPSALPIAREFRPDFVLMDIGLPGMSGYDLARAFRSDAVLRNATLIAISGYGRPGDREKSRESGFDHHLLKPVDLESLLPILAEASKTARPRNVAGDA